MPPEATVVLVVENATLPDVLPTENFSEWVVYTIDVAVDERIGADIQMAERRVRERVANVTGVPIESIYVRIVPVATTGRRLALDGGATHSVLISFSPDRTQQVVSTSLVYAQLTTMLEPLKTVAAADSTIQVVEVTITQETSLPDVFQAPHPEKKNEGDESGMVIAVSVVIALAAVAGLAALTWHLVTAKSTPSVDRVETPTPSKARFGRVNFAEMNVKGSGGKQHRFGPLGVVVRPVGSGARPPTGRLWATKSASTAEKVPLFDAPAKPQSRSKGASSERAPLFGAHAKPKPKPSSALKPSDIKLTSLDFRGV